MIERLERIVEEYLNLEQQLSDPDVLADSSQLRTVSKRYNDLGPVVELFRRYVERRGDAEAAREMLDGATGTERHLLQAELDDVADELPAMEAALRELMLQ